MTPTKSAACLGRPRTFCVEQALDRALQVFWQKGYEGASLSDLTEAMSINRPSLYAAYGNKEALFRKALDRYAQNTEALLRGSLQRKDWRAAIESFLYAVADGVTCPEKPHGCLTVRCNLAGSEAAESIRREITKRRHDGEALLRERLEQAQAEGELPAGTRPADLARYFATVSQGMSVQASGGATHEELRRVVKTALQAWPKTTARKVKA